MSNRQSCRRHLDDFTKGRVSGKLEDRSVTNVAEEFCIGHNIMSRAWIAFQMIGITVGWFSSGRS